MITKENIEAIAALKGSFKPDSAAFLAAVDYLLNGTRISDAAAQRGIKKSTAFNAAKRIKVAHAIICKGYGLEE